MARIRRLNPTLPRIDTDSTFNRVQPVVDGRGAVAVSDPVNNVKSSQNRFIDKVVKGVDTVTSLPNQMRKDADEITDFLINIGEKIKNKGGKAAEKNLTQSKVQSIGANAAAWVQNNMAIAAGAALLVMFLIFRR